MRIEPKIGGCSIVLLGNFNPAIFSPAWFARYEVVSATEAEAAEIVISLPDFTRFQVGTKMITVDPKRFAVETTQAPWVSICDVAVKTFGELLPHTPLLQIGINRQVHFGVGTEDVRNRMGRELTPTMPWGEWGSKIEASPPELAVDFPHS